MSEEVTVSDGQTDRTRMLSFRISPKEQRRIRLRAVMQGVTIEALLRQRVDDYLTEPVLEDDAVPRS